MSYGQALGRLRYIPIALIRLQLVGHRQQGTQAQAGVGARAHPYMGATLNGCTPPPAIHLQCMWGLHKMRCSLCSLYKLRIIHVGSPLIFWVMR